MSTDGTKIGCEIVCCQWKSKRRTCGYLEWMNNRVCLTLLLSIIIFIPSSVIYGTYPAVITTLERRFNYSSVTSGMASAIFGIFYCLGLAIIAVLGERKYKPLWIGWGIFIIGVGFFIFALPHFFAPQVGLMLSGENNENLCHNATDDDEEEKLIDLSSYKYLFFLSLAICGLGMAPLQSLGISYLDENVKQQTTSIYLGTIYMAAGLGPAFGSFIAGKCLSLDEYLLMSSEISTGQSIGAWWLYFVIASGCGIFSSFIVMMFPVRLNGSRVQSQGPNASIERLATGIKLQTLKHTFSNISYVFITLGRALNLFLLFGVGTFSVKVLEIFFSMSSKSATVLYGFCSLLSCPTGYIISGIIVTKMGLRLKGILALILINCLIGVPLSFSMLLRCPSYGSISISSSVSNTTNNSLLCLEKCDCRGGRNEIVCGRNGQRFLSPCLAGCTEKIDRTTYGNCSCVTSNNTRVQACDESACTNGIIFIVLITIVFFTGFIITAPAVQATLLVVSFNERTTAVAIQNAAVKLGTIPGKIVAGYIIDSGCNKWSDGSCLDYDVEKLSYHFTILFLVVQISKLIIFGCAKLSVAKIMSTTESSDRT